MRGVAAGAGAVVALASLSGAADAAADPRPIGVAQERGDAVRPPPYPPPVGSLRMVSFRASGKPASRFNKGEDITADGRVLAFTSDDDKMVPGANEYSQLYLRDLSTGAIQLVTRGVDGEPGNSYTEQASMSADGSRIVFEALASNLVPGASGLQIYLYDAATGSISLVSRAPNGAAGNDESRDPAISADGTRVVFQSRSDNLAPGAPVQRRSRQVYVADLDGGSPVRLVTAGAGGVPADDDSFEPSISGDGRLITFQSRASNLGAGERDHDDDIFVLDTLDRSLTQVSTSPTDTTGVSIRPEISDDGEHVVFVSTLSGLTDDPMRADEFHVYVRELASGQVERVTRAADGGLVDPRQGDSRPLISSDGSLIAFSTDATNLMLDQNDDNGYYDAFVYDNTTNTNTVICRTRSGDTPDRGAGPTAISGDGRYVVIASDARDLSDRDRDDSYDMFLRRLS